MITRNNLVHIFKCVKDTENILNYIILHLGDSCMEGGWDEYVGIEKHF